MADNHSLGVLAGVAAMRIFWTVSLLVALARTGPLAAQVLEIRFLDVGQGDAILVRSGRHALLVDAGLPEAGIVATLRALGVDSLELFLASHNHGDHIGGAGALLRALPVGIYIENDAPLGTPSQQRVDSALRERGIPRDRGPRRQVRWGEIQLDIYPPPLGTDSLQNNHSMVLAIQRGRFRALLTGDSERAEIEALLAQDSLHPVTLLKAPHHGDPDAVTEEWLAKLRPQLVVISVGAGNLTPATKQRYAGAGRELWSTDRDGDIVVSIDAVGRYTVQVGPHRVP